MARFYKTASATPLDYMYKLNVPLMERAIKANDAFVNQNLAASAQLETLGTTFPYGIDDEQRAKEIAAGYSGKANAIVDAIRTDPVNWRKQRDPIRGLSREIQADYKTGELSKIIQTHGEFKKTFDAIDEMTKEYAKTGKGLDPNAAMAYKADMLKKYRAAATARGKVGTGYDPTTGEYTSTAGSLYTPMANIELRKEIGKELEKIKADSRVYRRDAVTGNEWYLNSQTDKWEGVTPERLLTIAAGRLTDPLYQNYMKERQEVGLMHGVYDDKGNYIAPYSYKGVDISPTEKGNIDRMTGAIAKEKRPAQKAALKAQLDQYEADLKNRTQVEWSKDSSLVPMLQSLLGQHAWQKTEDLQSLKYNPAGAAKMNEAGRNTRQGLQIASNERIAAGREAGLAARDAEKMKLGWANFVRLGGTMPEVPLDQNSSTTRIGTNSFAGIKTTDWNTKTEVDKFSVAGMSSDINNGKQRLTDMNNEMKTLDYQQKNLLGNRRKEDLPPAELATYNALQVKKEQLQRDIPRVQSQLDTDREYYADVDQKVLTNDPVSMKGDDKPLTQEKINLYNKYKNNKELQDLAQTIKSQVGYGDLMFSGAYENAVTQWFTEKLKLGSPKMLADKAEYTEALKVLDEVNKRKENVYNRLKTQVITSNAVNLGKEDSKFIGTAIFNNPQGVSITDLDGLPTDIKQMEGKGISWFSGKDDDYNMTLKEQGGTNLVKYLNDHPNVTYTAKAVGTTTGIGKGGAVVQMTFDDPNGQIPKTPFYFELTPELQQTVGARLAGNKDLGVQQIAKNLTDNEANDIRKQLAFPYIQRETGSKGMDDGTSHVINIDNGQTQIPLTVTRYTHNGEEFLSIQGTVNGELVPLGGAPKGKPQDPASLPPSGMAGIFRDGEDFIHYLRQQRARKK